MNERKSIKQVVSEAVHSRRTELGMEQEELSDYAEVGSSMISRVENQKANITIENLERILDILGLEIVVNVRKTV